MAVEHSDKAEKSTSYVVPVPDQADGSGATVDEAFKVHAQLGGQHVAYSEADAKRVLSRIDMIMMPVMCIVFGLNFLDKTTLSYASVMGITKDLGISKYQYSWLGSIFYFGYLTCEFPASRLLQRLPLGKFLGAGIVLWGVTLSCFAAVHNWPGAAALRFFLGMLEATVFPGFALLNSQWWRREEHLSRMCMWVSFNGWAQIVGGLVAYGIARGNDAHHFSIAPWRAIFLLTGLLTVVMGTAFLIVIPDSQAGAWWLSKQDRRIALERVRVNQQGIGNKTWKVEQFREALIDPFTWAMVILVLLLDIPNGGLSNFFSLLITGFGYTPEQSLLYGTPAGAVEVVVLLWLGWVTKGHRSRLILAMIPQTLALIGAILVVAIPANHAVGRLVGYYFSISYVCPLVAVLSMVSSNVTGYTKKVTVAVMYMISYCVGNIIGPQTFRGSDAPTYVPAKVTIIVCLGLAIIDMLFLYWWCKRQNAKKAAIRAQPRYVKREYIEWLDLTDWENPELVYAY